MPASPWLASLANLVSVSPKTHYLKDKNGIPETVLWSPFTCSQACMCTCILVLAYYFKNINCILNLSQIFIYKDCFIYIYIHPYLIYSYVGM